MGARPLRARLARLLALLWLVPGLAMAEPQEPVAEEPQARERPDPRDEDEGPEENAEADPAPTPALPPDQRPVDAGEIRIRADTQGGEKEHYWFRGFADMTAGDLRIQCDSLDLVQAPEAHGGGRQIVAEGNVVFMRGDERLSGDRLTMDLASRTGIFENAFGYVQPGVFIEGKTIERTGAGTYQIQSGRFTSCAQPNPRWAFTASSARLHVDDKIVAKNVIFKVKGVPALYLPYLVYPIEEDERSTGLLFPSFGYSSERGFNVTPGFFWAMGRSADQTFYVDWFSNYGLGLGHELRYVRRGGSRGDFRSFWFRRDLSTEETQEEGREYDIDWNASQRLGWDVRARLNARLFSNTTFERQNQNTLNQASSRRQRASLTLDKRLGPTSLRLVADANETFFGDDQKRVNRRLPSFTATRTRTKLWSTGVVFSYQARAEYLALGDENEVREYSRFDIAPEVSRPLAASFIQLNPRLGLRYTRYGSSFQDDEFAPVVVDRPYLESSVELRGPMFSRVFLSPGVSYSDKFKHVVGPELVWTYRTAVDEFAAIPKYDGIDQLLGTHQMQYALVNSLLAKRPDSSGKAQPWELLSWRLQQTYYVEINENQAEFDPNYSSSAFGPGGVPSHYSPVLSQLLLRPGRRVDARFNLEYDINFNQFRTFSLASRVEAGRGWLLANWTRRYRLAEDGEQPLKTTDFVRGGANFELLPGRLSLGGGADYDIVNKRLLQWRGRLQLDVQCCGAMLELIEYDFNERKERQWRFSIQLANIGSMGSFQGEDQMRGGRLE